MAPCLNDSSTRNEVDVDPGDITLSEENVPPIFLLIIACLPVNAVCFRESASRS